MSSKILLDTNAYSELSRGDDRVLDLLAEAERVYIPVTVLGELFAGFRGGSKEQWNRRKLKVFLGRPTVRVLQTSVEIADIYSEIVQRLRKKRRPIPTNDIWIAAHAMDCGAVLVSFDAHFEAVEGLRRWKPE